MPLYEYECEACGHRFEVIQKFSDPLVEKCPKCGGLVHKLPSSPAIQFKGSGFYITDYGKGQSSSAKSDGSGSGSSDKGDKGEKAEKSHKSDSSGTSDGTSDKGAKSDRGDKSEKSEKGKSSDTSSSASTTPATKPKDS